MTTESLIAELTLQARPIKRLPHLRVCVEWALVTLLSLAVVSQFSGLRDDIAARLAEPMFALELALNFMLIVIAGCAATAFSYPDRAQAPFLKPALLICFGAYSALIVFSVVSAPSAVPTDVPHGIECFTCILSFAAMPALWLFWRLRQLASTRPMHAGFAALMMAVAVGCLGVRLVENETASAGVMLWHYLPLVLLSALGLLLGKKIFRW